MTSTLHDIISSYHHLVSHRTLHAITDQQGVPILAIIPGAETGQSAVMVMMTVMVMIVIFMMMV